MSTFAAAEPVARRLRRLARPSAVRVALLATSLAGAAYAVTLAVRLGRVLTFTYQDSDAASGPVMGEAVGRLGYHDVVLGHIAWYPQLWLYRLTAGLLPQPPRVASTDLRRALGGTRQGPHPHSTGRAVRTTTWRSAA